MSKIKVKGLEAAGSIPIGDRKKRLRSIKNTVRHSWTGWLLLIPFLFLMIVLLWKPLVMGVYWSFFEMKGYEVGEFCGLKNYITVMSDTDFLQTLGNCVKYVIWSLIIGYMIPVVLSVIFNELVHLNRFITFSIYFPSLVPGMAVALLWYYIFFPNTTGLLNQLLSIFNIAPKTWLQNSNWTILLSVLTVTWEGFGKTTLFYIANLQSINQELYEAAMLDGAGILHRVKYVTMPYLYPTMLLFFVNQCKGLFCMFEKPWVMTGGGPNGASMTLALKSYYYAFNDFRVGESLAVGVITFVILLSLTFVYKYIEKRNNYEL